MLAGNKIHSSPLNEIFQADVEEKTAENLLIFKSKTLAGLYVKNWFEHKNHSEKRI